MRAASAVARAVVVALAVCGPGCADPGRHAILRAVFDGVPPPRKPVVAAPRRGLGPDSVAAVPTVYVHPPYAEKQCEACHDAQGSNNVETVPALCFRCHDADSLTGAVVHPPVADGQCLTCHDPHQSLTPRLLVKDPKELCQQCHAVPAASETIVHAPVAAGQCTACHEPHAGGQHALLRAPVLQLCASCHGQLDHVREMVAESTSCTECHAPHGSANEHLVK